MSPKETIESFCDRVIALADAATSGPLVTYGCWVQQAEEPNVRLALCEPDHRIKGKLEKSIEWPEAGANGIFFADARTSEPALARALKVATERMDSLIESTASTFVAQELDKTIEEIAAELAKP